MFIHVKSHKSLWNNEEYFLSDVPMNVWTSPALQEFTCKTVSCLCYCAFEFHNVCEMEMFQVTDGKTVI